MTSFTTPRTWTSETLTSTLLNTHLRDNENYLFENIHSGSGTAGWASFTPSWTNLTVSNGVNVGKKGYAGKTTFFYISLTFGSSTSVSGAIAVAFPDTAVTLTNNTPVGNVHFLDSGTAIFLGSVFWATTALMSIYVPNVASTYPTLAATSSTVPFTWTTNDQILIQGAYERA
jgi:hypothetical protein